MLDAINVIDPDIMNGTPCYRGTRVPFKTLMDCIEGGHSQPMRSEFQSPEIAGRHALAADAD
jgi:hypothetical protein